MDCANAKICKTKFRGTGSKVFSTMFYLGSSMILGVIFRAIIDFK